MVASDAVCSLARLEERAIQVEETKIMHPLRTSRDKPPVEKPRPAKRTNALFKTMKWTLLAFVLAAASIFILSQPDSATADTTAKYVIVMIGDGMGPEHVKVARNFNGGPLAFEGLAQHTTMTTYAANDPVTDSAASATAMAAGQKVNNGVISIATPGDGSELETLLETYKADGKSVGLVTTTYMTHATPAAFGAHNASRNNTSDIGSDYISQTMPNVLFGGGGNGMSTSSAASAGYTVVSDRTAMQALNTESETFVSGQFGSSHLPYEYDQSYATLPHLHEMTQSALAILDNNTSDGFFLMVEGGRIDHAAHDNNINRNIDETLEFGETVQDVIDWIEADNDSSWSNTILLVTADHETGGLTVLNNPGQGVYPSDSGSDPDVTWLHGSHTDADVDVFAQGVGASQISAPNMDNTNVYDYLKDDPGGSGTTISFQDGVAPDSGYAGTIDTTISQNAPATNYGNDASCYVDGDDPSGSGDDLSTLFRWDVSAVPAGSTVEQASITLNVFNLSNDTYELYQLLPDWVESEATWNLYVSGGSWQITGAQGPADRGSDIIGTFAPGSTGLRSIQLNSAGIAMLQNWVDSPASNHGVILADNGAVDGADFDCSETGSAANRPKLTVTYSGGTSSNIPPAFNSDPIVASDATEDAPYSGTLAGSAADPDTGDTLTYTKVSGPTWLDVAANGALSGTPTSGDLGPNSWTVAVEDGNGGVDQAQLQIEVLIHNDPPAFDSNPISKADAIQDAAYASSLAGDASDPDIGDSLTFSKVSGPAWLSVAENGALSGTPANEDVGNNSWTVAVSDSFGAADETTLEITVLNVNDEPAFDSDPIVEVAATEGTLYASTLSDDANDPDPGDSLTFSKLGGPIWLSVAGDGTLSGTPGGGNIGLNSFTVAVTDGNGGSDSATLNITVTPLAPVCLLLQPDGSAGVDSYIKQDRADENRGENTDFRVKGKSRAEQRSLILFDLSVLPTNPVVDSMMMTLWVDDLKNGPVDVSAHQITQSWTESGVTWNDRDKNSGLAWDAAGGSFTASAVDTITVNGEKLFVSWDLTGLAPAWTGGDNLGVLLKTSITGSRPEVKFKSSEEGVAAYRPALEVCYFDVPLVDLTPPVITLVGADPLSWEAGSVYADPGANAVDNIDGDISANIVIDANGVNTAALGSYTVTYNVSDAAGNAASEVVRTVNVVDTTAPLITLLGSNPVNLNVGDPYVEAGATATDIVDGDLSANIVIDASAVDTAVQGSYPVTYNISDAAGNAAAQVVRTVVVGPDAPLCIVLQPGAAEGMDSYLKQDKSGDNKGGDSDMRIKSQTGKLQRSLLQFDLFALPPTATVDSMLLTLWVEDLPRGTTQVNARQLLESWSESSVTWDDRDENARLPWSTPGGSFAAQIVDSVTVDDEQTYFSWDLTNLGSAWVSGDNHGVLLETPASSTRREVKFKSSDEGTAAKRPQLDVCYYP